MTPPPSYGTEYQSGDDHKPYADHSLFPVRTLLDAGATQSYIGPELWSELRSLVPESAVRLAPAMILANGDLESTIGEVPLPIQIGEQQDYLLF